MLKRFTQKISQVALQRVSIHKSAASAAIPLTQFFQKSRNPTLLVGRYSNRPVVAIKSNPTLSAINYPIIRPYSTVTHEVPHNNLDLKIKSYLREFSIKVNEFKKLELESLNLSSSSNEQIALIKTMLDKLVSQVNEIVISDNDKNVDLLKYLKFLLSHIDAIHYHLKLLLGESVFTDHSRSLLLALSNSGYEILKEARIDITPPIPETEKATTLTSVDNFSLELKRYNQQSQYHETTEFKQVLTQVWAHALQNGLRTKRVFISYAWPNEYDDNYERWSQDLVMKLATHLSWMGFQVFLDKNHSGAGFLLAEFMKKIQEVDHVLVISTRTMGDKLKKPNSGVNFEYKQINECLLKHPHLKQKRFIIPVLLNNSKYCHPDLPNSAEVSICKDGYLNTLESLASYMYYDIGSSEFSVWWQNTISQTLHPRFVFNEPPRDQYKVSRNHLQEKFLYDLKEHSLTSYTHTILTLHGFPGTGKTHLLRHFFLEQKHNYFSAAWFNAENKDTLVNHYRELATKLKKLKGDETEEEIIEIVKNELSKYPQSLLVYDNARSWSEIEKFIPYAGYHHILVSSLSSNWPKPIININEYPMSEDEACQLVQNITHFERDNSMIELVHLLHFLPLAVSYAAAYMKIEAKSCRQYVESYKEDLVKILSKDTPSPSPLAHDHLSVWITWHKIQASLEKSTPAAMRALKIASLVGAENIPVQLLEQILAYQAKQDELQLFISKLYRIRISVTLLAVPMAGAIMGAIYGLLISTFVYLSTGIWPFLLLQVLAYISYGLLSRIQLKIFLSNKDLINNYYKFSPAKYPYFESIYSKLIAHSAIIANPQIESFSIHRLTQDILRKTITIDSEAVSLLIGVWIALSEYYKTLKHHSIKNQTLLWQLQAHFKAANNLELAKNVNEYIREQIRSTTNMFWDDINHGDEILAGSSHVKWNNFSEKYEDFLQCYKELCLDLNEQELANSITNEIFKNDSEKNTESDNSSKQMKR